jgi:hypothetical protein
MDLRRGRLNTCHELAFVEDISRGLNSVHCGIDISSSGLRIRVPKYFSHERDVMPP